jgi:uncharacterized integral membrane protein
MTNAETAGPRPLRGTEPGEVGTSGQPADELPSPPAAGAAPETAAPGAVALPGLKRTRASATWTAIAVGLALLAVVLVFILENLQDVKVSFFSVHWRIPLALDLLLAAILGGLIVFTAGAVRLLQLRMHARRERMRRGHADEAA